MVSVSLKGRTMHWQSVCSIGEPLSREARGALFPRTLLRRPRPRQLSATALLPGLTKVCLTSSRLRFLRPKPGNPKNKLSNPNQLFSFGAFHGGVWRCAYEVDSIGEASVLLYFSRLAKPYLYGAGAAGAAAAAVYFGYAS
jgi:hypothetical protein